MNALGRDGQRRESGMKAATDKVRLSSAHATRRPRSPAPLRNHSTFVPRPEFLPPPTGVRATPTADTSGPHLQLKPWGVSYVTTSLDKKLKRQHNRIPHFFPALAGFTELVRAAGGAIVVATHEPRTTSPSAELAPANKNQSAPRLGGAFVAPAHREFFASPKASEGGVRTLVGRGKFWANRLTVAIGLRIFLRVPPVSAEHNLF